jgi:hypothetical protein
MIHTVLDRIRVPSANLEFVLPALRKSSKRNLEWLPVRHRRAPIEVLGVFIPKNKTTPDSATVFGSNLVLAYL